MVNTKYKIVVTTGEEGEQWDEEEICSQFQLYL